jgi:hypothetical protein
MHIKMIEMNKYQSKGLLILILSFLQIFISFIIPGIFKYSLININLNTTSCIYYGMDINDILPRFYKCRMKIYFHDKVKSIFLIII